MPQTLIEDLLLIGDLLDIPIGLGVVWFGLAVLRASRSRVPDPADPAAPPRRPISPLETGLRGMLFLTVGLTMMSYGVTGLRYTRGHNVTVPPSAPLLDQVIWKLFHACLWSLFALAMAVGWVRYAQNRRVRR